MDITDDDITLTLSEYTNEPDQWPRLEAALRSGDIRWLFLQLQNYDGVSHLDVFRRTLELAPEFVQLSGRAASPNTVGQFLDVLRRRGTERSLRLMLRDVVFPAASLTNLFRLSRCVNALFIFRCQVEEAPGQWEGDFTRALNENAAFGSFLIGDTEVDYLAPVLVELGNHPTLQVLCFIGDPRPGEHVTASIGTASVIKSLLMNGTSPTLQIQCKGLEFNSENFAPIADGAVRGQLVDGLFFDECSFNSASTLQFESMFQPTSNLRALQLEFPLSLSATPSAKNIIKKVLSENSPLLLLRVHGLKNDVDGRDVVAEIMTALEGKSSLLILSLCGITGADQQLLVDAMSAGIPKLWGLKMLRFSGLVLDAEQQSALLDNFKGNHTILSADDVVEALQNEEEKEKIRSSLARNAKIAEFLQRPELGRLPEFVELVQDCYHSLSLISDFVKRCPEFGALQAISDSEHGSTAPATSVDESTSHFCNIM